MLETYRDLLFHAVCLEQEGGNPNRYVRRFNISLNTISTIATTTIRKCQMWSRFLKLIQVEIINSRNSYLQIYQQRIVRITFYSELNDNYLFTPCIWIYLASLFKLIALNIIKLFDLNIIRSHLSWIESTK